MANPDPTVYSGCSSFLVRTARSECARCGGPACDAQNPAPVVAVVSMVWQRAQVAILAVLSLMPLTGVMSVRTILTTMLAALAVAALLDLFAFVAVARVVTSTRRPEADRPPGGPSSG